MKLTHNLWSARSACLMTTLTCFAPVADLGVRPAAVARSVQADSVQADDVPIASISGTVVDHATNLPVSSAIVALEQLEINGVLVPASQPLTSAFIAFQQNASSVVVAGQPSPCCVDRIVATTISGPDGSFVFSGLTPGNFYDVVVDASVTLPSGATQTYTATITTGVPVGATLAQVPLVPELGDSAPGGQPADISAMVTTSPTSSTPTSVNVVLSALQGFMVRFTIPPFAGSTQAALTTPAPNCPSGTQCAAYKLLVPSADPVYGMFTPAGTSYNIPSDQSFQLQEVIYFIEGRTFFDGTGLPNCSPSAQTAGPVVPRGTLVSVIPNLNYTACK